MKKFIICFLILAGCASQYDGSVPSGFAEERNLTVATDQAALILLPADVSIEYLDGRKTEFHEVGTIFLNPGNRSITIRYENEQEISEYITAEVNLEKETYFLEMKRDPLDRAVFTLNGEEADIPFGSSFLYRKSDNIEIPEP